jgi:PEP-CTERM motif
MLSTNLTLTRMSLTAALGLTFAICQPAQAANFEVYTSVDGGTPHGAPDMLRSNTTGEPLVSNTGSALATVNLLNLHVSASDTTHWTLGPYAAAHGDLRFSVAGSGEAATVSFSFLVNGGIDLSLDSDHNVSAGYSLELTGLGADGADAGVTDVNCLGCGGHLESSYERNHGVTTLPWDWSSINKAYTLTTTVESGRMDAGLISVNTFMGLGNTQGNLNISMTSVMLNGQSATLVNNGVSGWSVAAVPEPSTYGLAMAGLLVLGLSRRRRT